MCKDMSQNSADTVLQSFPNRDITSKGVIAADRETPAVCGLCTVYIREEKNNGNGGSIVQGGMFYRNYFYGLWSEEVGFF